MTDLGRLEKLIAINDSRADQMWMGLEEHVAGIMELAGRGEYENLTDLEFKLLQWSALAVSAQIQRNQADREMLGLKPQDE